MVLAHILESSIDIILLSNAINYIVILSDIIS